MQTMRNHPIRKFFSLLLLYAVLIFGIFILQFKKESVISHKLGNLNVSLAQTELENNTMTLQNQFTVNFKGLNFSANDNNPVLAFNSENQAEKLELESFSQPNDLSAMLKFKDGSAILFSITNLDNNAELFIQAKPSANFKYISIPYSISSSYNSEPISDSHILFSTKNNFFTFAAYNLDDNRVTFSKNDSIAKFLYYDPSKRFTFEAVTGLANTNEESINSLIKEILSNYVTNISSILVSAESSNLTELEITAFVAELASKGKYNEAINQIPETFKKGNKRTYISAPYFNNLANINKSLIMQMDRLKSMVNTAISSKDLDIFTIDGISDYILTQRKTQAIKSLLSFPSSMETFEPKAIQGAGIINIYTKLYTQDKVLSEILKPLLEKCLESISNACSLENNKISIRENNENLSISSYAQIGNALIELGKLESKSEYSQTGYLIIYSALESKSIPDFTIAELYPILIKNNTFYPHTEILGFYGNSCVWAWTCAESITYKLSEDSIANINIDFPQSYTHYIIFNGIPNFHGQIEIQKQMFRTDPRFEIYNSSGYVYQNANKSLLIKSRHKSKTELIRLFCDPVSNFYDLNGNNIVTKSRIPVVEETKETETVSSETTESPSSTENIQTN